MKQYYDIFGPTWDPIMKKYFIKWRRTNDEVYKFKFIKTFSGAEKYIENINNEEENDGKTIRKSN